MPGALDMTLDEMIASSGSGKGGSWGKGKKGGGKGRREDSDSGGWKKGGGRGESKDAGGKDTKLDMALDDVISADSSWDGGSRGKGKGKSGGSWESEGKGWGKKGSKGGGKSGGKDSWSWGGKDSWGGGKDSWGGGKDSWGGGKGGGSWGGKSGKGGSGAGAPGWMQHDDWRGEADYEDEWSGRPSRDSWGGGGGRWGGDDGKDRWGASNGRAVSRRDRSPSWQQVEQPRSNGRGADRNGGLRGDRDRAAPVKRGREDMDAYHGSKRVKDADRHSSVKRIKVTNVPRDLAARDIKEAFEAEAGKTTSCELDRGTAYLSFMRHADAKKAVETFDRGELNGKTISVTLEP